MTDLLHAASALEALRHAIAVGDDDLTRLATARLRAALATAYIDDPALARDFRDRALAVLAGLPELAALLDRFG